MVLGLVGGGRIEGWGLKVSNEGLRVLGLQGAGQMKLLKVLALSPLGGQPGVSQHQVANISPNILHILDP